MTFIFAYPDANIQSMAATHFFSKDLETYLLNSSS